MKVIWDNAPAHRGEAMREYLRTPGLGLQLVNLLGYSPDFKADDAIWGWARVEDRGNRCLGTRAAVQEKVGQFLAGLTHRKEEVEGAAGQSCNPGQRYCCKTPNLFLAIRQMHIPPWH